VVIDIQVKLLTLKNPSHSVVSVEISSLSQYPAPLHAERQEAGAVYVVVFVVDNKMVAWLRGQQDMR
jgi:hypothetical protein